MVTGKPAPTFFADAVAALGLTAGQAAMVGDDLENDVLAAQRAGLIGIAVRTGKFGMAPPPSAGGTGERPDHVIASIADLPALLR